MADEVMDTLIQIVRDHGTTGKTFSVLHAFLNQALRDGEKRETLLAKMEELRKSVSEEQEDILLDVMDCLVGWCHPDHRIKGE